ncbi:hypothetical protein ACJZ2D_005487 [Fusarium nematophilum]
MTINVSIPGTVQLVDTQGLLNLSDHSDDPLRWTPSRKTTNVICAMSWCFFAAAMISGLSPAYVMMEQDTGISVADLSTGNGLMYLFLGWGTLTTQCLTLNYGRRPTLLVSIIVTSLVTLWSAYVKTRGEFFADRIIVGIVSSPMETLIEVIIGDVFYVHDQGFYMGMYCWTLWSDGDTQGLPQAIVSETFATGIPAKEKKASTATPDKNSVLGDSEGQPMDSGGISTKTYADKLKIWGSRDPQQPNTFKFFVLPFQLLRYPGNTLRGSPSRRHPLLVQRRGWFSGPDSQQRTISFQHQLHRPDMSDIMTIRLARRNNGVMEPGQRLWICVVAIFTHPAGCLLFGVGASYQIHWVGIVFGLGLISVTLPIGSSLAFTYILDSHKEVAGEGLVSAILVRNTMGFAFSYAVVPMIGSL